jgi:enoyl-CoA hydratase/carnithine racemase
LITTNYMQIEKENGVVFLILNNPPANTIDTLMLTEMEQVLENLEQDEKVKVIVLKSSSKKMFSAGADVALLENTNQEEMGIFCRQLKKVIVTLQNSKKISIAAIEGHCLGGGLELAMGCDLRVAKDSDFRIGLPEIKLGLFPGGGGIQLAGRIIGAQKALRLAMFGDLLSVSEANEWGLIDYLFPEDEYSQKLEEIMNKIANGPSIALSKVKHLLYSTTSLNIESDFEYESKVMMELLNTKDFEEGIQAFKEKRVPQFKGQ